MADLHNLPGLLGIAAVLFAWTNVDDLFVLLGFFADAKLPAREIILGQYLGIGVLYGVSVLASMMAIVMPPAYIGLLGLAPILIGIAKLRSLRQGATDVERRDRYAFIAARSGRNVLTVTVATVANGGDNISVYTPLFATRSTIEVAAAGLVFAIMTAVWCLLGHWLVHHPALGIPIRRYAHRTLPFLLICFGIAILWKAGTFNLF